LLQAVVPASAAETLDSIPAVYGSLYVVLAFRRAYGATLVQSLGRTTAVLLAYSVVVGLVAVGIALVVIFGHGSA
jgi:hypothetical protein